MQIVDVLDCTGSGDVNVTSKAQADPLDPRLIKGVYGNDLKLNPDWVNPSGVALQLDQAVPTCAPVQYQAATPHLCYRRVACGHQKSV